eukprot:2511693-Rhodomonas_salina.6
MLCLLPQLVSGSAAPPSKSSFLGTSLSGAVFPVRAWRIDAVCGHVAEVRRSVSSSEHWLTCETRASQRCAEGLHLNRRIAARQSISALASGHNTTCIEKAWSKTPGFIHIDLKGLSFDARSTQYSLQNLAHPDRPAVQCLRL